MKYILLTLLLLVTAAAGCGKNPVEPDAETTTIEQAETTIMEDEPIPYIIPTVTGRDCDPRAIRTNLVTGETYCNRLIERNLDQIIDDDWTTTTSSTTSSTTSTSTTTSTTSTSSTTTEETTSTIEELGIDLNSRRMLQ